MANESDAWVMHGMDWDDPRRIKTYRELISLINETGFLPFMTELQMQTYLTIKEFQRKRNKKGQEYGMSVCVYCRSEDLWGYDVVTDSYNEEPLASKEKIYSRLKELYPDADEKTMDRPLR